ncbi:hypothetical protein HOL21_04010 [Candidatus Woesearchaeota archaeon]|nr:hypothetical protein [Candidatus Woesearchaeota archaeon]MBT5397351.1 hypothetical protein [Candidatus Woesearchaeota archaeon]MBT5924389.1 hypothetical protein [Candidatus Woesearchaeota archaeon]MBT6367804.1 hypothetical protein [Candidatus Woesearchaeota archaeon]MBT7762751.1 hypothetical protein [Candidatus Woesearchaeota archaeon]
MFGILCFGDSITFGVGERPTSGWVGRLKEHHETKDQFNYVVNLGFPGHNSFDLLERIEAETKTRSRIKRPTDKFVIILSIGTNDCRWEDFENKVPKISIEDFRKNINSIIEKAKKNPAEIVFVGIPPVDEKLTSPFEGEYHFTNERVELFNNTIKEACEENKVLFLDILGSFNDNNTSSLFEDGLHPNSEGYELIYEKIKEFLIKKEIIK